MKRKKMDRSSSFLTGDLFSCWFYITASCTKHPFYLSDSYNMEANIWSSSQDQKIKISLYTETLSSSLYLPAFSFFIFFRKGIVVGKWFEEHTSGHGWCNADKDKDEGADELHDESSETVWLGGLAAGS